MKKILIIEDDKVLRENTAEFLKEEGFQVYTAEDGLVGVQIAMKYIPDLIICDIIMPNMNGYDFYKTIQQIKTTTSIPLIFLTAKIEKEDLRMGMQLGADDYITKPFDFNELLRTINIRFEKYEKLQQMYDEKFYTMIDNPLMGVFIYKDNKFDFVNNAFAKIFGLYQSDFSNLSFESLIAKDENKSVFEKIQRCINGIQNTVHVSFKAIHKDKENIFVEVYASRVSYKGDTALIGDIIDSTHVSKDEKILLKNNPRETKIKLSKRESEILALLCKGQSSSEIGNKFGISSRTVDTHRTNLLGKTGTKNTAELILFAIRNNFVSI